MSLVLTEVKDNVGIVTVNRPEALNALNADVLKGIGAAMDEMQANDDVYVVILTGSGRSFVAGADIAAMSTMTAVEGKDFSVLGNDMFLKVENMTKPVIAAVNGFALGGGCELCMSCDMRIASDKAKFGQPETGLGVTPGFGGTQRLPRLVGLAKAKELIYTCDIIDAAEAERIGLVSYVVPGDQLMDKAMEIAKKICANGQVSVRQSKKAINAGMQTDIQTALSFEAEAFGLCFATEDQTEGMAAFVEKRKEKNFKNK